MHCIFTDRAERDLEEIGDRIAEHNPRRAISYVQEMRARCEKLTQLPGAFMVVDHVDGIPVRKARFEKYRIYYLWLDEENAVIILHIRHSARQDPDSFTSG